MKRKIILWVLTLCLIVTLMPLAGVKASAATGAADNLIAHAKSHLGDKYNTFGDREAFQGDWCVEFIEHCAAKSELSAKIPTKGYACPNEIAYNIVNKKSGKITFVNKNFYNKKKGNFTASSRTVYNANYKPRKGDLIIFSSDADYWWTHIGIVTANSSTPLKNVSTIEGNTNSDYYKTSTVAKKTRSSTAGFYIVAYVTPDYTDTYYLAYSDGLASTKNDSSVIPTQTVKRGVSTQTTTKKFTRTGYDYTHWYIFKKDANGYANYWCRDKATGKKAAWYRYDKIPSTYYKVTFPHGGKIYFTVAANTTLYLTPVWVKNKSTSTSSSSTASKKTYKTSGLTMPYTLVKGTSYSLSGTVTSTNKYKITSGTVGVYNSKGKAVYAKKLSNNSKTLKISRFDKYIKFGKLKSGTYYYKIKIKRNGKTATILNHKVKVNYSNYVYYSDKYNGYTYQQFGWTRFKEQGCYVTSAAMVISNKRGKKITPDMVHKNLGMRIGTICPDTPDWDTLARKNGLKGGICKTSSRGFNVDQIKAFAKKYPQGVMCDNGKHMFVARYNSTFDLYFNDPAADGPRGYSVAAKDHLKKLSSIYNKNNNKNVVNRMIALY